MPLLSLKNLSTGYGDNIVLKSVDFNSPGAELVGVIGANGTGKSTLLKAIAGLLPYSGHIMFENNSLANLSRREQTNRCAYMAQNVQQTFPFRVEEIVAMGLAFKNRFFAPPTIPKQIAECLSMLGFEKSIDDYFGELSIGQQQIVMLAQTLIKDSPLVLLDEPSAPLDYRHTTKVIHTLKERVKQGTTVLMALHDLNIASQSCDRILLLKDAQIKKVGSPKEVLQKSLLEEIYNTPLDHFHHPETERPVIGLSL